VPVASDVDEERLRAAVAAARDKAPRVRELQAEVRRAGGARVAADAVERLAGSRRENRWIQAKP
jgi:hypothetical protein